MHHTGKKESKEEKEKKKQGHEKYALRVFEPGPSEDLRTKNERLYPLTEPLRKTLTCKFKRGIYSFSMVTDSFQG